jgi:hypothetical protein
MYLSSNSCKTKRTISLLTLIIKIMLLIHILGKASIFLWFNTSMDLRFPFNHNHDREFMLALIINTNQVLQSLQTLHTYQTNQDFYVYHPYILTRSTMATLNHKNGIKIKRHLCRSNQIQKTQVHHLIMWVKIWFGLDTLGFVHVNKIKGSDDKQKFVPPVGAGDLSE